MEQRAISSVTRQRPTASASVVQSADWREAADGVLRDTLSGHETPPDLVVLFASSDFSDDYPQLVREVYRRTGTGCLIGSSSRGAIAGGESHECKPAISLIAMWLPGATLTPVRLHQAMLDAFDHPEPMDLTYGPPLSETRGWIVFADPFRMDAQDALLRLRTRYPDVPVIGALSATMRSDRRVWVFFDDHVYDEGGVALAIGGPYSLQVSVSQGADPIGEPWTITGVERNLITSISNRPAADVMENLIDTYPLETREMVRHNLMLGFPMNEYQDDFYRGDFVIRGLMGIDEERRALIVGTIPREGQTIQFQLRDAVNASLDTQQMLVDARAMTGDRRIVAGIMCTCRGRGAAMFGRPDHDACAVQSVFEGLPIAGMFSFGEIGPVRGVAALNGFAMCLGLVVHEEEPA